MRSHGLSIKDKIILLLLEPRYRYKGIPASISGLHSFFPNKIQSLRNALFELKKEYYILADDNNIKLGPKGREHAKKIESKLKKFESPFYNKSPKNLLLIFDIPEHKKSYRNWFRKQLKDFEYIMIQKSVWVGPSPLPKEFTKYTKEIGLANCIKTFKLAKPFHTQ